MENPVPAAYIQYRGHGARPDLYVRTGSFLATRNEGATPAAIWSVLLSRMN